MPRPRNCRLVGHMPPCNYYKPRGIPLSALQQVTLTIDEAEAIRLADLMGMYQNDAAEKMNISRQTFGRILESAHKKIADALINGKALAIEGGPFKLDTDQPPQNKPQGHGFGHCRGRGRRHRGGADRQE